MKIYGIKDIGSGFNQVLLSTTDYNAKRGFAEIINGPKNNIMAQYPKDFSLWYLGDLDQDTGALSPSKPALTTEGINLLKQEEKTN